MICSSLIKANASTFYILEYRWLCRRSRHVLITGATRVIGREEFPCRVADEWSAIRPLLGNGRVVRNDAGA